MKVITRDDPNGDDSMWGERDESIQMVPCPFCTKLDADGIEIKGHGCIDHAFVECNNCRARGPIGMTLDDAVMAWNDRKE